MPIQKKFISIRQQKILIQILNDGKINFSNQILYKNRICFNKNLNELVNSGWLKRKKIRLNGHYSNEYELTLNGIIIVESCFVNFYESNN